MKHVGLLVLVFFVVLSAVPASAGVIDLAVGVHGGIQTPIDEDGPTGTVLGVKLRILTPVPMVGFEGYYNRIGQEKAEEMWAAMGC